MFKPETLVIWKSSDSDGPDPVLAKVVGPVDFERMEAAELSAWYVEHVGYDLAEDDPAMALDDFRLQCGEMYALHNP